MAISAEDVPGLVIYHHGNNSEQGPSLLGFCPNSIYKLDQFPENIVNFFNEESESQFIPTFNKEDFDCAFADNSSLLAFVADADAADFSLNLETASADLCFKACRRCSMSSSNL